MLIDTLTPDDIYESAFITEKWPKQLGMFAKSVGAVGGGLFTANGEVRNWTASSGLKENLDAFVENNVLQNMGRRPRTFDYGQHSFVTEQDMFSEEELENDPLYRDFLRPRGLGWSARTSIKLPTGDNIIIALERAYKDGPVPKQSLETINKLRPHLARAALMSSRLQLEKARSATDSMAMLGLPALLFDTNARVLAANDLIEKMPDCIKFKAFGNVAIADKRAHGLFERAVVCASKQLYTEPYSFSVCAADGTPQKIAHIVPICGESRDVFVRSAGMLILTPVVASQSPSTNLLQSLFDLTAAEARVACNIAKGDTVEDIASINSLSVSTVRAHMRNILEKTGCHRQLEVATLLNGLSIVRNLST